MAFRMIAARLNYMAQDNPWLQIPVKEVCRNMAKPRSSDFMKIKRLVRFLKGAGGIKFLHAWQNNDEACDIPVLVDSDWVGNTETRKSTSGGVLKVGKHVIRTWSSTQNTVATSSGKAELIAMYDGATRGLEMQTVMTEMGLSPQLKMVRISTDSSVAKSFVATRGLGDAALGSEVLVVAGDCADGQGEGGESERRHQYCGRSDQLPRH